MPAKDDVVVSLHPDPLLLLHHFLGLYCIVTGLSRATEVVNTWDDNDPTVDVTIGGVNFGQAMPLNPKRGTQGGEPKWIDGPVGAADSNRSAEDNLNGEKDSLAEVASGWYVTEVRHQGEDFTVDTRDYFIDFRKLVTAGLLQSVPESASQDNGGGSATGSYGWYVKSTGEVESLFFHFPTNGTDIEGNLSSASNDQRGFIDGVYP